MARKSKSKRRSKRADESTGAGAKIDIASYQIGSIINRPEDELAKAMIICDDHIPADSEILFSFIQRNGELTDRRLRPFDLWVYGYEIIETMTRDEVKTLRGAYRARNLPTVSESESGENGDETASRRLYEGFPMTPVIRWMGSQEWSEEDVAQVFEKLNLPVATSTIKINTKAGLLGKRGKPADLDEDQAAYLESLRGGSAPAAKKKQKRGRSRRTK